MQIGITCTRKCIYPLRTVVLVTGKKYFTTGLIKGRLLRTSSPGRFTSPWEVSKQSFSIRLGLKPPVADMARHDIQIWGRFITPVFSKTHWACSSEVFFLVQPVNCNLKKNYVDIIFGILDHEYSTLNQRVFGNFRTVTISPM